jgi:hypothetical protein
MNLIIDLSQKEKLKIALEEENKEIAAHSWSGLYRLSETLLTEIDKFLKSQKLKLDQIKDIQVIPSEESIVSTRIAKATALGLKFSPSPGSFRKD